MLSTTAEYALRIMIFLTESPDGSATSDVIAEETKVPAGYTIKVLQWLGRANMVRGQRGRRGGFRLDCYPQETCTAGSTTSSPCSQESLEEMTLQGVRWSASRSARWTPQPALSPELSP